LSRQNGPNRGRKMQPEASRTSSAFVPLGQATRWKIAAAVLSIAIVAAWLWCPSIRFGFVYDDHLQIESNPELRSWAGLIRSLHEPLWAQFGPERASPYYRPLFSSLLWAQSAVFGPNPLLWHLVAIGLHILVALALFSFLLLHFRRVFPAWVAACVFAFSPLTAEVVNWVSAENESECVLFFLLALCGYSLSYRIVPFRHAVPLRYLSAGMLALAVFSKETAAAAIPLAYIYEAAFLCEPRSRPDLRTYAPVILPLIVFLLVHPFPHFSSTRPFVHVLSTIPTVATFAIRKLVWPLPVSEFYDLWIDQAHSAVSIAMQIGLLALIAGVCGWLATRSRFVAWTLLVIFLPMTISLAGLAFFRDYDLFHDRYLYWPFAGCAMLVAAAIAKAVSFPRLGKIVIGAVVLVLCTEAGLSRLVSDQFSNDLALYAHAVDVAPHNIVALQLIAEANLRLQDCPAALGHLQQAEQLRPDLWQTSFYLGIGELRCGLTAQSATYLKQSTVAQGATKQQLALSWYELGRVEMKQGDTRQAKAALQQAAMYDPGSTKIRTLLEEVEPVQ